MLEAEMQLFFVLNIGFLGIGVVIGYYLKQQLLLEGYVIHK